MMMNGTDEQNDRTHQHPRTQSAVTKDSVSLGMQLRV